MAHPDVLGVAMTQGLKLWCDLVVVVVILGALAMLGWWMLSGARRVIVHRARIHLPTSLVQRIETHQGLAAFIRWLGLVMFSAAVVVALTTYNDSQATLPKDFRDNLDIGLLIFFLTTVFTLPVIAWYQRDRNE